MRSSDPSDPDRPPNGQLFADSIGAAALLLWHGRKMDEQAIAGEPAGTETTSDPTRLATTAIPAAGDPDRVIHGAVAGPMTYPFAKMRPRATSIPTTLERG
jgi:hypothetical protein